MAPRRSSRQSEAVRRARATFELWADCFDRHNILTYASAIALRALVALIPLTLLGLAFLGAFGLKSVWHDQLAPPLHHRLTQPTYHAIDAAVRKVLEHGTLGLIAFAGLLAIWNVSSVVRASMGGLNAIYEQTEERPALRRFGLSLALGIGITLCLGGAALAVTAGRRLAHGNSALEGIFLVMWWVTAILALALAVGLIVHFAPARRRAEGWVGLGTLLVVGTWIAASLLFGWFVSSVANFKTAAGQLAVFLVLTTFVYTSSIIFLVGVQLDELLRKGANRGERGLSARLRGVTGG